MGLHTIEFSTARSVEDRVSSRVIRTVCAFFSQPPVECLSRQRRIPHTERERAKARVRASERARDSNLVSSSTTVRPAFVFWYIPPDFATRIKVCLCVNCVCESHSLERVPKQRKHQYQQPASNSNSNQIEETQQLIAARCETDSQSRRGFFLEDPRLHQTLIVAARNVNRPVREIVVLNINVLTDRMDYVTAAEKTIGRSADRRETITAVDTEPKTIPHTQKKTAEAQRCRTSSPSSPLIGMAEKNGVQANGKSFHNP